MAGLLQGSHPLVRDTSTRAWGDTALVVFIAAAALALRSWGDRPTWPRALLVGVLVGGGASAKLSPLLLAVPLGALGLVLLAVPAGSGGRRPMWRDATHLAAMPAVALATFVASYPYLCPNPATHLLRMLRFASIHS